MSDTPNADSAPWEGYDAVVEVVYAWERFERATTAPAQASALVDLSNAMSDLASWAPRCCEGGYAHTDHICEQLDGSGAER